MLRGTRQAIKYALASRPGWWLAAQARRPRPVVLAYHRVGPREDPFPGLNIQTFRQQAEWLHRNCEVVAPEQLRECVAQPRRWKPQVLLTFDDGYRSYAEHVYPVLEAHSMPALVFLATGYVDNPERLYESDRVWLAVQRTREPRVVLPWPEGAPLELGDRTGRARAFEIVRAHLKHLHRPERDECTRALLDALRVGEDDLRVERQALDWSEVRKTMELTRYGGHTHSHPILSRVSGPEADKEVALCRQRIESETGRRPVFFAYPNGQKGDFDAEAVAALRRHGFEGAFSAIPGRCGPDTDWMAIPRISGNCDVPKLALRLTGLG